MVSALPQVLRCQSPNGLYTIDFNGDYTQGKRCYNINRGERIQRLNEEYIGNIEKEKEVVRGEVGSEGSNVDK